MCMSICAYCAGRQAMWTCASEQASRQRRWVPTFAGPTWSYRRSPPASMISRSFGSYVHGARDEPRTLHRRSRARSSHEVARNAFMQGLDERNRALLHSSSRVCGDPLHRLPRMRAPSVPRMRGPPSRVCGALRPAYAGPSVPRMRGPPPSSVQRMREPLFIVVPRMREPLSIVVPAKAGTQCRSHIKRDTLNLAHHRSRGFLTDPPPSRRPATG
jgi:hypothetical protein